MRRRGWISGWSLRVLVPVVGVVVLAGTLPARAEARPDPVTGWVRHHAAPLTTVDPAAPLGDLTPLRRTTGDAEIVGLGESTHGAAEEIALKHRTLRLLVERMGFRSIAWEEDWTTGLQINEYIRTGKGDLNALVRQMSPQWQSQQVAHVLAWLRDYNAGRTDKVRFVGVEYYLLGSLAYDAVDAYVAATAPGRLAELRRHLRAIRPSTANMFQYIQWYLSVADKGPYVRHARQVYSLVRGLPHRTRDRAHALALHHARQIVSFYVHYSLPQPPASDSLVYRDAHAAQNLRWWHRYSGDKVAYWGASAAHRQRPPAADRRAARPGLALCDRRLVPAPLVRTAVCVDRLHLRPRHRQPRARGDRHPATVGAGLVRATVRQGRPRPVRPGPPHPRPGTGPALAGARPSGPVASPTAAPAPPWPAAPWPSGST